MAETELSNEVVATTTLPEITNLSVTEVSNGFELSWSINDNNTTGNIAIERSTDNGNTFNRVIFGIPRTTETFTDSTNFDTDNPIYRIVRATDDAESVSSEIEYTEPTIPEEVPVAETLESTVTDDGIELTWRSDETDGEFIVYRDTDSGTTGTDYTQIDTVPAFTFNQYLDSGVSSGERYYYRTEFSEFINPFTNPSFETGDFTGWTTVDNSVSHFWDIASSSDVPDGTYAAVNGYDQNGFNNEMKLYQNVDLTGISSISFTVYGVINNGRCDVEIYIDDTFQENTGTIFDGGPETRTTNSPQNFTGTHKFEFRFVQSGGDNLGTWLFDNITVNS